MLKKCCAIAMLLLMTASFTIGSVDATGVSTDRHDYANMYWKELSNGMALPPLPLLPPLSGGVMAYGSVQGAHSEERYTNVILDLSGQNGSQSGHREGGFVWHGGFMPPSYGAHVMPANDYIMARMIVQKPGANAPSFFPVKFFRYGMSAMTEKGPVFSYRANMTVPMGDEGSFLTFNGELRMVNDSRGNTTTVMYSADTSAEYNSEITMGQTDWHQAQVSGMQTALNVDLKWNDSADQLRLMVYTPDGHVLGPYTDATDGKTDGRINVEIDNPSGVADGTWLFKVTGTSVTGKDEYYIRTW